MKTGEKEVVGYPRLVTQSVIQFPLPSLVGIKLSGTLSFARVRKPRISKRTSSHEPGLQGFPVSEFLYLITKYFVKFMMCSNVDRAGWLGYREIAFFPSRVSVNGLPYEHFSLFTWTKVG